MYYVPFKQVVDKLCECYIYCVACIFSSFPIAYCIDAVVDTQVQQVNTGQTLDKCKVVAPVVLF